MGRSATLGRRVGERYTNHQVGNDCLMIIMMMTIIMMIMLICNHALLPPATSCLHLSLQSSPKTECISN